MAFIDITPQFRELVTKSTGPGSKRRKSTKSSRKSGESGKDEVQTLLNKEYLQEAYNILKHIEDLSRMLANVRRTYLAIEIGPSALFQRASSSRSFDSESSDQPWTSIKHLTNEERDQIDLQARLILSKCVDRVKQLEALERRRKEAATSDENVFTRMLPTRLKQSSSSVVSANRAAHHASITYYLNRCLAEVSQRQKEMQEERVKRQLERTRTLGSTASQEAASLGLGDLLPMQEPISLGGTKSWLGDAASNLASSIGLPSPSSIPLSAKSEISSFQRKPHLQEDEYDMYDSDDDFELSASQIQQFESENATILRSVQDTLAQVQQAESRLLDISALQTELVAHLTQQAELTDQLFEDAVTTTATVEKGNLQLQEAKRRAKDGRLYLLVFLLGASFALLFLHYY